MLIALSETQGIVLFHGTTLKGLNVISIGF